MKKMALILFSLSLITIFLSACGTETKADYTTKQFETALNNGDNLDGKTVSVDVEKLVPNSAFGYNIEAGDHLNFVSATNPNVKKGNKVIVKVKNVKSMLGSYIITYKMVKN